MMTTALGVGAVAMRKLFTADAAKAPAPDCCKPPPAPPVPPPPPPTPWQRVTRLMRQLFARQDEESAWVLVLGAAGAGKTSLATSAAVSGGRHHDLATPPKLPGAVCHSFPQGVLIDASGALKPAEWNGLLDEIAAQRPRRPLDALMLTVSTDMLAQGGTPARLAAEALRAQLYAIQLRYQWVLPVYVVVTGCDRVATSMVFNAATAPIPAGEMIGWSAPEVGDYAGARRWSDLAFDQLANRFRQCQLQVARRAATTGNAYALHDAVFLLPHRLEALRAPLAGWLDTVFKPSDTQQGLMMRGVYFTGATGQAPAKPEDPRADVRSVSDLVTQKVLAERRLAEPTRTGRRAQRMLRAALRWSVLLLAALLALTLAVATVSLKSDLDQLDASLHAIATQAALPATAICMERERVDALMDRIEQASLPRYVPWSWFDTRAREQSAREVAATALDKAILPALVCKLAERGKQLSEPLARPPDGKLPPASYMVAARDNLLTYLDQVLALEQDHARLRLIAPPNGAADPQAATRALYELLGDLYGRSPQSSAADSSSAGKALLELVTRALASTGINWKPSTIALPAWKNASDGLVYQSVRYAAMPLASAPPRAAMQANITLLQSQLPTYLSAQLTNGAKALAQLDKDSGGLWAPALLDGARKSYAWLSWVQNTLVSSTPADNPCQEIAGGVARRQSDLAGFGYQLTAGGKPYSPSECYTDLIATLRRQSLPGYGPVVTSDGAGLRLNPALQAELTGLGALLTLDYMQMEPSQEFQCLRQEVVWQRETIQRARDSVSDYQLFARTQGVTDTSRSTLFDRLARRQLELVLNDTLANAQSPAAVSLAKAGLGGAGDDVRLSRLSADFGATAAPLASMVQLYVQMGMRGGGTALSACVRGQASDGLTGVSELVESGRLYMPLAGTPASTPFNLGGAASLTDYLSAQVARVQVLAGYATPYVQVLQDTPTVDDAHKLPSQSAPYWINTIKQLNQYLAHDNSGEVGKLNSLIAAQLPDADAGPCGAAPSTGTTATTPAGATAAVASTTAPSSDAGGNDLFSARRLALQAQLATRCDSRAQAQLTKDYSALSDAFNTRLAGRYPFGPLSGDDAPAAEVKQFFADYGTLLASVRARYAKVSAASVGAAGSAAVQRLGAQRDFLGQIDDLGQALQPGLNGNLPLRMAASFYARPQDTQGSEQLVVWTLSSGAVTIGAPNRQPGALDWPFGQALSFDLEWADRSSWRPLVDRTQRDLQISGTSAQFGYAGEWALLRMVELHRLPDTADNGGMLLQFQLPVAPMGSAAPARATGQTRVYLNLGLSVIDPKTQAATSVKLPLRFPHFAPR